MKLLHSRPSIHVTFWNVTVTRRNVTHKKHFFFLFSSPSIFIITCSLRVGSETVGKPIYEAVLEHFNELKTVKNCSKNAKNILNDVTSRRISKRHRYVTSPRVTVTLHVTWRVEGLVSHIWREGLNQKFWSEICLC